MEVLKDRDMGQLVSLLSSLNRIGALLKDIAESLLCFMPGEVTMGRLQPMRKLLLADTEVAGAFWYFVYRSPNGHRQEVKMIKKYKTYFVRKNK
jgi:hypothetical protein